MIGTPTGTATVPDENARPADDVAGAAAATDEGALGAWVSVALAILVGLTLFRGTAVFPLMDPDEGRNAEVAREMAERGDFVVPHLNGLPYLDKPVFLFAAAALAIDVLGATELAARLPSVVLVCLTSLLLALFGRRLLASEDGWIAGLAYATCPLVIAFANLVIFDAPFAFWVTGSCMAFYLAWTKGAGHDRWWWAAGWAAAGAAVLTKGPVGLVLPVLINAGYGLVRGGGLRRMFSPLGIVAFLAVALPWFLAVVARHPEFPHYAFVRETLQRVLTDRMQRTGAPWYFLPLLVGGTVPWSIALLLAGRRLPRLWRRQEGGERPMAYLLLWVLVPLVFFTLSQSKRPGYILPAFPAVCLLAAHLLADPRVRRRTAVAVASLAAFAGVALFSMVDEVTAVAELEPGMPAMVSPRLWPFVGGAFAVAGLSALGWWARVPRSMAVAGLALLPLALSFGSHDFVMVRAENRGTRDMARVIRGVAAREPGELRVVGVDTFPASLAFYLESTITVSSAEAYTLRSNYIAEYADEMRDRPGSTLRPEGWWRTQLDRCAVPTVFVVEKRHRDRFDELVARLPLLSESGRYAAYGPCR